MSEFNNQSNSYKAILAPINKNQPKVAQAKPNVDIKENGKSKKGPFD